MGDLIQITDYQKKPKVEAPLSGLTVTPAFELPTGIPKSIDEIAWPGMDIQAPYMSPEKDPA